MGKHIIEKEQYAENTWTIFKRRLKPDEIVDEANEIAGPLSKLKLFNRCLEMAIFPSAENAAEYHQFQPTHRQLTLGDRVNDMLGSLWFRDYK